MNINYAPKFYRLTAESLGVSMSFDRQAVISTVNSGWNLTLGSGVT